MNYISFACSSVPGRTVPCRAVVPSRGSFEGHGDPERQNSIQTDGKLFRLRLRLRVYVDEVLYEEEGLEPRVC